jgi:hypothetical protein
MAGELVDLMIRIGDPLVALARVEMTPADLMAFKDGRDARAAAGGAAQLWHRHGLAMLARVFLQAITRTNAARCCT